MRSDVSWTMIPLSHLPGEFLQLISSDDDHENVGDDDNVYPVVPGKIIPPSPYLLVQFLITNTALAATYFVNSVMQSEILRRCRLGQL